MIRKKKFITIALDLKNKAFIVYIASISRDFNIYLFFIAQIAFLKADKILTSVSSKYTNFIDIFSKNLAAKLLEYIKINKYIINLIEEYLLPYGSIYNLELVELEVLEPILKPI